jgi:hypothetical protein
VENETHCEHQYTFTKDDLFRANPIFAKRECERCGKLIVADGKYKLRAVMLAAALLFALLPIPSVLRGILPDISYFAKGLIVALAFVMIYSAGLFAIMRRATYHLYTPPKKHLDDIGAGGYVRRRKN